jgi:hypothetical protein
MTHAVSRRCSSDLRRMPARRRGGCGKGVAKHCITTMSWRRCHCKAAWDGRPGEPSSGRAGADELLLTSKGVAGATRRNGPACAVSTFSRSHLVRPFTDKRPGVKLRPGHSPLTRNGLGGKYRLWRTERVNSLGSPGTSSGRARETAACIRTVLGSSPTTAVTRAAAPIFGRVGSSSSGPIFI